MEGVDDLAQFGDLLLFFDRVGFVLWAYSLQNRFVFLQAAAVERFVAGHGLLDTIDLFLQALGSAFPVVDKSNW